MELLQKHEPDEGKLLRALKLEMREINAIDPNSAERKATNHRYFK